jgi:membrane glycosyltransferase
LENAKAVSFIAENEAFREQHLALIQPLPSRKKGTIDSDKALAEAKLKDAQNADDVQHWLTKKEAILALHDKSYVKKLTDLSTH